MSRLELQAIAIAMILTLATPLIGSRRWFPHNRFGTIVLFLAGVAIGGALYRGNVPPKWFDGSSWGFTIALTLIASAFGFKTAEERFYRLPWLFGFGATLLVCNIWAKVA